MPPKIPFKKNLSGVSSKLVKEDKVFDKVQLDPDDFRRVAILLDIHPKVYPKEKNSPFPYFHRDDLSLVNHSSMAWFIRDYSAYLKKYKKKYHRKEEFYQKPPNAPYADVILSRYPSFADSVRDLDDALTTIALFAQMQGNDLLESAKKNHCQKLLAEFHFYISRVHALTKSFISVRGYYFSAQLEGIEVIWLIPHNFPLENDPSVDFKVMINFLELYENLLGFVNAKLFIELGMKYPPEISREKWDSGFYIDSIMLEDKESQKSTDVQVSEELTKAFNDIGNEKTEEEDDEIDLKSKGIFGNFYFTLDPSVPRDPVSFVIRSLGGRIAWNENSLDSTITHTITDRKSTSVQYVFGRKYVQPQWVFDSLNEKKVVDEQLYIPGQPLPPHLSPFEAPKLELDHQEIDLENEKFDSDQEIDDQIKTVALETEFAAGFADDTELNVEVQKPNLEELKNELKEKRKAEREQLAANLLSSKKNQQYRELKAKERQKERKPDQDNIDQIPSDDSDDIENVDDGNEEDSESED